MSDTPYSRTLAALDALHAEDPRRVEVAGESVPRELWHAGRMSAWLERLHERPDELMRLAVRGQHLQRWQVPRSDYPEGRVGYLTWRRDQGQRAGETTGGLMREAGFDDAAAEAVQRLSRKQEPRPRPGPQAAEGCAWLGILEKYLGDLLVQVGHY